MATAAVSVFHPTQVESTNFLNLLIVDDERAIREACREVAQSLGISLPTAERYWAFARTWLYAELSADEPPADEKTVAG